MELHRSAAAALGGLLSQLHAHHRAVVARGGLQFRNLARSCRTMNSKECVARGCSLQAAMLSPIFQVRNFDVKDTFPFKVSIAWQKDDGPSTSLLFGASEKDGAVVPQYYPSVKTVSFHKTEPFTVTAAYTDDSPVPAVRVCVPSCVSPSSGCSADNALQTVTVRHAFSGGCLVPLVCPVLAELHDRWHCTCTLSCQPSSNFLTLARGCAECA